MEKPAITLRSLLIVSAASLVFLLCISLIRHTSFSSGVVFCNVGQGDGVYIRLQEGIDILIDAGPANGQMATCLEQYMPPGDTVIEYVFLSHSQIDHYGGLITIMKHYRIRTILMPPVRGTGKQFAAFEANLKKSGVRILTPVQGQSLSFSSAYVQILWPSAAYVNTHVLKTKTDIFGMPVGDDNMLSMVCLFSFPSRTFLFTGDAPTEVMKIIGSFPFIKHTILKLPHHGSKTGINLPILQQIAPSHAIISVGRNNPYGHPSADVVKMLQKTHIPYERTDTDGDIIFSDNKPL